METIPAWTCQGCATVATTPYCPQCGEQPVLPQDLTLRGVLRLFFNAFSKIDVRLLRTLGVLFRSPGALTLAWINGPRKPHAGPIQIFLLANLAFVAAQSFAGAHVFSSTLDSHLHQQDWSPLARRLVSARLEREHTSLSSYAPTFDRAVAVYAKSLVVLMAIPFALVLPLTFFRERRPFAVHMVFALHTYAFILLIYCAALAVSAIDMVRGGAGLDAPWMDTILTVGILVACAAYLYAAIGRVYGSGGATRAALALVLSASILAITLAYRFVLLLFTLWRV